MYYISNESITELDFMTQFFKTETLTESYTGYNEVFKRAPV